jgi:type IV secretory pathway VirJ component
MRTLRTCLLLGLLALAACVHAPSPSGPPDGVREVKVPERTKTVVLVLSGDGGWWGDIERRVAERIAAETTDDAVIGFDTQDWFASRRTPDEIAAHIAAVIDLYAKRTGAVRAALVGYSFGADVLPLVVNRMGAGDRERIKAIVLIALARGLDPQVTPLEQAGLTKATIDLAPEIARLPKYHVMCLYGRDEGKHSGCTLPEMAGADARELPGGHHFDGDVDGLAKIVMAAIGE